MRLQGSILTDIQFWLLGYLTTANQPLGIAIYWRQGEFLGLRLYFPSDWAHTRFLSQETTVRDEPVTTDTIAPSQAETSSGPSASD